MLKDREFIKSNLTFCRFHCGTYNMLLIFNNYNHYYFQNGLNLIIILVVLILLYGYEYGCGYWHHMKCPSGIFIGMEWYCMNILLIRNY